MEQDIGERDERLPASEHRSVPRSLDLLNLLLIDVNGAIKPYLNVYLFVHRGWSDAAVGLVGTVSGLVGIAAQVPIGTAIDAVRDKRMILLGALVALSVATLLVVVAPHFWPVLAASCVLAAVGGMLTPAVAALTLGLFVKLPDQSVSDLMQSIEHVRLTELKGLSRGESKGLLDYFARSGIFREQVTDGQVAEKWSLSGGGIVGELCKLSARSRVGMFETGRREGVKIRV